MDKNEIIERLGEIAKHAVHTIGEEPFIMSLDDGTAVYEAIDIIQQSLEYLFAEAGITANIEVSGLTYINED